MKEITIRGRKAVIPSLRAGDNLVIVKGSALRVAEVFDEYWVEAKRLPDPGDVIALCRRGAPRADLFTFAQRVPDTEPRHAFRHEWDNIAASSSGPASTTRPTSAGSWRSTTSRRSARGAGSGITGSRSRPSGTRTAPMPSVPRFSAPTSTARWSAT